MAVTTGRKRGRKKRGDIDIVIGRNLCALRQTAGLSQTALAERLDMSYRQVQKYEQGMDRIASSTLYCISSILKVPVTAFFEGVTADMAE